MNDDDLCHKNVIFDSLSGGSPNFFSSSGFAPQWPGAHGGDANPWGGMAASETLGDWTSPLMEVYDEQQLQAQRERLRQKLSETRSRQERFRQQQQQQTPPTQRRSHQPSLATRHRDNDPFESYANEQVQSASVPRLRRVYAYPTRRKHQLEQRNEDESFSDRYGMASW